MKRLQLYAALIFSFFVIDWSGLLRYVDVLFFWFQLISLVLPILKGYSNLYLGSSASRNSAITLISDHEKCTFFLCKYHFWFTNFLKFLTVWNVFILVVDQLFISVSIGIIRPIISRSLWISQYLTPNTLLVADFLFLWGLIGLPRFNLYYLSFCIAFFKMIWHLFALLIFCSAYFFSAYDVS